MNCAQAERKILLLDADELSQWQARRLEKHLAACERCRAYQAGLARVMSVAGKALPAEEPSESAILRIREASRIGAECKPRVIEWPWTSRPLLWGHGKALLAYAAAALVLLGGAWFIGKRGEKQQARLAERSERVAGLNALVTILSETEPESAECFERADKGDIKALAQQLLVLEGLNLEEFDGAEEDIIPPEEQIPTDSQGHSAGARQARRCV